MTLQVRKNVIYTFIEYYETPFRNAHKEEFDGKRLGLKVLLREISEILSRMFRPFPILEINF